MEFDFGSSLLIVLPALVVLSVFGFLLLTKSKKKSDPSIVDPRKLHPPKVFFKYNHDSIYHWVTWIKTQDTATQEKAFEQIVNHLSSPVSRLGVISADAIRALNEFTTERAYMILRNLLVTCSKALGQYKSIEIFYEDLAMGLTKFDKVPETEAVLIEIFHDIKKKSELIQPQIAILKALGKLEFNQKVIQTFDEILANRSLNSKVKSEALSIIEAQESDIQKRVFLMILDNQLKNQSGLVRDEDEKLLATIFLRLKKYLLNDECSDYLWDLVDTGLASQKHNFVFIKLICDSIELKDDAISNIKLLELLAKPEPARTPIKEAFVKRNSVDRKEQEVLRTNIKQEDLVYEKSICKSDKSKTAKAIAYELLNDYKALEKDLIMLNEASKSDKQVQSINVILGNGIDEKIYLLKGLAANNNRSFVYVDAPTLYSDPDLIQSFRTTVNNSKPCLVYMDNLDIVLEKNFTKNEIINVKNISRIVGEFSILPSVRFVANLPYTRDDLQSLYSLINERLSAQSHGNFRIIYEMNKPDFIKRRTIISSKFADIKPERIEADSGSFDIDDFAESTDGMSYLEYGLLVSQYFEISLMIFGRLVSYKDFVELNQHRVATPTPVLL
jgi:hypothetical protein